MAEDLKRVDLPPGFGQTRGSEHEVWLAAGGTRVIKATHGGEFGRKFGPVRFATRAEYLERIQLINEEFGLGWRTEGTWGEGKTLRVVTSQPAFAGRPPSRQEIRVFMRERAFVFHLTRFGDAWFRRGDGLLVSDAEPKNAVVTVQGLMPFDFLIARPAPELLALAGIS